MKKTMLLLAFLLTGSTIFSQGNCNCDHYISNLSLTNFNQIKGDDFNYQPGDVFCLESGNYRGIRLVNFKGTKDKPLIFRNNGGEVFVNESTYPAIEIKESAHIIFTGTGDDTYTYGFKVTASNSTAVGIAAFSSDIEMDHIKVESSGFAGFMAKTNPVCHDRQTWRRSGYIMKNINLHHNYIKDTEGEGFYIGSTGGYKVKARLKCGNEDAFPHWLENVDIHHNIVENAGWDGIQVNLVRKNGNVYNNTITGYGVTPNSYQKFAMSIGGGVYNIYNNVIKNTQDGKGMQFISAQSGTKIYNNIIINPKSEGIFLHSRHVFEDPNRGYFILNNTIINPEKSGVKFYSNIKQSEDPSLINTTQIDVPSYFVNNIIVNPGNTYETGNTWKGISENYFDFNTPAERDAFKKYITSNLLSKKIDTLGFTDYTNHIYTPNSSSSAMVDTGENLVKFGITSDLKEISRPQNNAFDIGAYELKQTVVLSNKSILKTTPINSQNNLLNIYPNPSQEFVKVDSNEPIQKVSFYNTNGNLLEEIEYPKSKISLKRLKQGVYFMKINYSDRSETHQIIKK
ncbi:conserved protein of unknown function precursor containing a type A C-terminal secretion signal [Tenacibaculum sp. 190524A02b]|uniref:T9SS type A sorting domain-containing protein n=1 Tax=Tenacibaculum vairaonense TaxID=3137860 RepID=UPI0032B132DD